MHLHGDKRTYTGNPDELVCECLSVERQEIEEAIEVIDALTVGEVRRECAAGGGCGSCHEEIARLILSRRFGEVLDFESAHVDEHDEILPIAESINKEVGEAIEQFLAANINPHLESMGVIARITEIGEEVVIDLAGANEELKYTLSFWIDNEFDRLFSHSITVIIA
jgi:NifU-like protein